MKLIKKLIAGLFGLVMATGVASCGGWAGSTFNEQKVDFYEQPVTVVERTEEEQDYAVDLCFAWNAASDIASKFEAKAKYLLVKIEGKDSALSLDRIKISLKAEDGADGKYTDEKYRSSVEVLPIAEKDLEDTRLNKYISKTDVGNKYTSDPRRALKVRLNLTELAKIEDILKLFTCETFKMSFDLSNGVVSTIDSAATLKWEYAYDVETKAFRSNTYATGIEVKGCKDRVEVGEEYTIGENVKVNLLFNQGPAEELSAEEYDVLIEVDTSVAGEGKVTFSYLEFDPVVIKVMIVEPEPVVSSSVSTSEE